MIPKTTTTMIPHPLELQQHHREGRGVSFDESVDVHPIPLRTELTAQERSALWLTRRDVAEARADVCRIVKMVRQADHAGTPIPDDVACLRGLEHLRSAAHFEQRKINRDVCLASLYDEQKRQRLLGIRDEEALACASEVGSRWARALARQIGASDEAEARKLRHEGSRSHRIPVMLYRPFHSYGPAVASADASTMTILERTKRVCDSRVFASSSMPDRRMPAEMPLRDPQLRKQIGLHLESFGAERSNKIPRLSGQKVVASSFVAASLLANNGPS